MNHSALRIIVTVMLAVASMTAVSEPLSAQAQRLFDRATQAAKLGADTEVIPTKDGRSFFLVSEPQALRGKPHRWVVSLHGSNGFATRDLEIWSPYLKDRNLGIISLQWWFGGGGTTQDYYSPFDIYREADLLMRRMGIKPGDAMLQGFSRGSANLYAVAALDRNNGQRYFGLFVANAGGASPDYPPTRAVDSGRFGDMPYKGTRWITAGVFHRIIGQMPPHSVYVEPFAGSAAVFFAKARAESSILIDRSQACIARLSAVGRSAGVNVIQGDALEALPALLPELPADTVIYCDPPYLLSTRRGRVYYAYEMSDQAHGHLLALLKWQAKCRVLISGYPSELYGAV